MTSRRRAASRTVRASGPRESRVGVAGIIPNPLTSGSVGLSPTMDLRAAGPRTEPKVSSPTATAAMLADTATPDPEEEPLGSRAGSYGFRQTPYAEPA